MGDIIGRKAGGIWQLFGFRRMKQYLKIMRISHEPGEITVLLVVAISSKIDRKLQ
jgi:hypothetical protein